MHPIQKIGSLLKIDFRADWTQESNPTVWEVNFQLDHLQLLFFCQFQLYFLEQNTCSRSLAVKYDTCSNHLPRKRPLAATNCKWLKFEGPYKLGRCKWICCKCPYTDFHCSCVILGKKFSLHNLKR